MKIELRSVRYNERMSDETSCFDAVLVIDGKPRGHVRNRGCGGCHEYDDWKARDEMEAFAKTQPDVVSDDLMDPHDKTKRFTYKPDADHYVSEALSAWLGAKEVARFQKKMANGSILYISAKNGEMYELKTPRAAEYLADPSQCPALRDARVILNKLTPSEQAQHVLRKV